MYFVCADDVPGCNDGTGVLEDEQVFRKGTVTSIGQIIAVILAKNKSLAQSYAKEVKVHYTKLYPVLTIEVPHDIATTYYISLLHRRPLKESSFIHKRIQFITNYHSVMSRKLFLVLNSFVRVL